MGGAGGVGLWEERGVTPIKSHGLRLGPLLSYRPLQQSFPSVSENSSLSALTSGDPCFIRLKNMLLFVHFCLLWEERPGVGEGLRHMELSLPHLPQDPASLTDVGATNSISAQFMTMHWAPRGWDVPEENWSLSSLDLDDP